MKFHNLYFGDDGDFDGQDSFGTLETAKEGANDVEAATVVILSDEFKVCGIGRKPVQRAWVWDATIPDMSTRW